MNIYGKIHSKCTCVRNLENLLWEEERDKNVFATLDSPKGVNLNKLTELEGLL